MEALPWEKRFHFQDGTAAQSLEELKSKVERISYDEFYRFVGEHYNHFANWVEHVLHKHELATRMRKVSSIVETVELLEEAIHKEKPVPAGLEDLQAHIEAQLFGKAQIAAVPEPLEEPVFGMLPPPPEDPELERIKAKLQAPELRASELREAEPEEPRLPSPEELETDGRAPREPVVSPEPAHVPITRLARKPEPEEHLQFLVKEAVWGFVLGLVTGLILGRVLSWYV